MQRDTRSLTPFQKKLRQYNESRLNLRRSSGSFNRSASVENGGQNGFGGATGGGGKSSGGGAGRRR